MFGLQPLLKTTTTGFLMAMSSNSISSRSGGSVVHWFRKGLRLEDNGALCRALSLREEEEGDIYPVYVLDGDCYQLREGSLLRANFLIECLADLDSNLRAKGSRLYVIRGDPTQVLPDLWKQWNISHMTMDAEETLEPYAKKRDSRIYAKAAAHKVKVHAVPTETLFSLKDYVNSVSKADPAKLPSTMTSFQHLLNKLGTIPKPIPAPDNFSPCNYHNSNDDDDDKYLPPTVATQIPWPRDTPKEELDSIWTAQDCQQLNKTNANNPAIVKGGETAALQQLHTTVGSKPAWVKQYNKPMTKPNALHPSTCVISPYLATGCLSPRTVWYEVEKAIALAPASVKATKPPVSLYGQILWREFNHLIARSANLQHPGSWGKMKNNPYCRQIPWDTNPEYLQAWKEARTGYPWIDACMTQLNTQGWIHHLARHAVACFLTRGDLYQSWEKGAKYFESQLLDADYALNNFNWMWLSCSGFFYQYFRCYSPIAFGKKTDPQGLFIRKWLPQLAKLPDKYIYEPWKAPISVQKQAGIKVGSPTSSSSIDQQGKDVSNNIYYYPRPIVDHTTVSKANMGRLKLAYDHHKELLNQQKPKPVKTSNMKKKPTSTATKTKKRTPTKNEVSAKKKKN